MRDYGDLRHAYDVWFIHKMPNILLLRCVEILFYVVTRLIKCKRERLIIRLKFICLCGWFGVMVIALVVVLWRMRTYILWGYYYEENPKLYWTLLIIERRFHHMFNYIFGDYSCVITTPLHCLLGTKIRRTIIRQNYLFFFVGDVFVNERGLHYILLACSFFKHQMTTLCSTCWL